MIIFDFGAAGIKEQLYLENSNPMVKMFYGEILSNI